MTRSEWRENLAVAMGTLRAHKMRSFLTMLGVVIGVASVIAVAAIIQGLNQHVADRVQRIGARVFFVTRFPAGRFGRMPEKIRKRKYLEYEDAVAIRQGCRSCQAVTPFLTRAAFFGAVNRIRFRNETVENSILRGVEPDYADVIPLFTVREGRFITQYELEHAEAVCVLGAAMVDSLFPHIDPLGQEIRVNGYPFRVIGVFEKDPGLFGGPGVDRFVVIPYTTFHKLYPEIREHLLAISVAQVEQLEPAKDEVTEIVRRRRHVASGAENDFEVTTPDFLTNLWKQLTGAIVILTLVISSIGLLVGGIGVMNIMLVSVTERTQEIGIRKAVGARRADIQRQFLIEAITLTGLGGIVGILLGTSVSLAVKLFLPSLPTQVSLFWVLLGFTISVSVGLFFGLYPANRAARLDPVICLRYE